MPSRGPLTNLTRASEDGVRKGNTRESVLWTVLQNGPELGTPLPGTCVVMQASRLQGHSFFEHGFGFRILGVEDLGMCRAGCEG